MQTRGRDRIPDGHPRLFCDFHIHTCPTVHAHRDRLHTRTLVSTHTCTHALCLHSPVICLRIPGACLLTYLRRDGPVGCSDAAPGYLADVVTNLTARHSFWKDMRLLYLSARRCSLFCSLFCTHLRRQQVRKAMDMSRMMAQLTMEAITATLKPKVSCGGTAARENHSS